MELGAGPENQVFGEATEVGANEGEVEENLGEVIAVGDGVHGVGGDIIKAEFALQWPLRSKLMVEPANAPEPSGQTLTSLAGVGEAADVAGRASRHRQEDDDRR